MGLIDHEQKIMSQLAFHSTRQIEFRAVHAVETFADQQSAIEGLPIRLHQVVKFTPFAICERNAACAGQPRTSNDAVVCAEIRNDSVGTSDKLRNDRDVGQVPADKNKRVLRAQKLGETLLQLGMQFDLAGND